ncbi:hypothetical protein ABEF93_000382 [Exophiala dermatitidis]
MDEAPAGSPSGLTKRRIPKACGSCRASKVKCDGQRPCSRPPDPTGQRIEALERELQTLKGRLSAQEGRTYATSLEPAVTDSSTSPFEPSRQPPSSAPNQEQPGPDVSRMRDERLQLSSQISPVPNFADKGLITMEQAELFFNAFFQGCDRYVPIFDPSHDTFHSVKARSALLFDAIVTIGCGVLTDADSQICHLLHFQLKKMLNLVVVTPEYASLETVQALLVIACYSSERSLLLAFATRMALDLGLPEAYEELTKRLVTRGQSNQQADATEDAVLMRRTRAWFQLIVLEQILRVDAGTLRSFRVKGDARRCRILLDKSFSTVLDLRLLSQVELNALRARMHDSISSARDFEDENVLNTVRDAQIDLEVWYSDWHNIMCRSPNAETPVLLLNLKVQKYWSQAVVLCRAVRALGNENIAAMSMPQREILLMAKDALGKHLRVILDEPQHYLAHFRFAMDFVWAKCAFCFLLLLKLVRFFAEDDDSAKAQLLEDGYRLLRELNKAGGGSPGGGGRSHASKMYLQVLQQSIQKYGRALRSDQGQQIPGDEPANIVQSPESPMNFFWTPANNAGQNELESWVPEQFVFEWDFPGLTLFSAPSVGDDFFEEFFNDHYYGGESPFLGMPG